MVARLRIRSKPVRINSGCTGHDTELVAQLFGHARRQVGGQTGHMSQAPHRFGKSARVHAVEAGIRLVGQRDDGQTALARQHMFTEGCQLHLVVDFARRAQYRYSAVLELQAFYPAPEQTWWRNYQRCIRYVGT